MQGAVRLDRAERLIGTRLGQSQQIFRRGMQGRGYVRESARRGLPISREVFRDVRLGRPGPCSELGLVDAMPAHEPAHPVAKYRCHPNVLCFLGHGVSLGSVKPESA